MWTPPSALVYTIDSAMWQTTPPRASLLVYMPPPMGTGKSGPRPTGTWTSTPYSSHKGTRSPSTLPLQGNIGQGQLSQAASSTIPYGWGHREVYWSGTCCYGVQRTLPHKTRGTGHPTMFPVSVLQQAGPVTKPSKDDPPSSPTAYIKRFKCIRQTCPQAQMQHDHSCIILTPQNRKVHYIQVQQNTFPTQRCRIQLWMQRLCSNHHKEQSSSHNVHDP